MSAFMHREPRVRCTGCGDGSRSSERRLSARLEVIEDFFDLIWAKGEEQGRDGVRSGFRVLLHRFGCQLVEVRADCDAQVLAPPPRRLEVHVELAQTLRQLLGGPVEGVPALAEPGGAAQRGRGLAADVDGRVRLLDAAWGTSRRGQVVDLAVERRTFVAPERAEDLEVLVGPAASRGPRAPEGSNSSFSQPTPMPRSTRPSESQSSVATSLAM